MKYNQSIIYLLVICLVACKKDFLQQNPESAITTEDFFKTPQDLETYSNTLYDVLPGGNQGIGLFSDIYSDNISTYTGGSETDIMIRAGLTPATVSGWDEAVWGQLRNINYFLVNAGKATGAAADIDHYIGIARFFRSYFYYNMVKKYGDVPWYSGVMNAADEALLYKASDPRTLVVDSVISDLEFAAGHIKADGSNTRVTRWAALTLLARVALHEGTYRTYHTELGLQSTAASFLQKAVGASNEIMTGGGFDIYRTGSGGLDFRKLFSSSDLSGNSEIIFYKKNSVTDEVLNLTHNVLDWQWALSRSLADEFLMTDGTPFTSQPGYNTKTFVEMFQDRDPRMAETIMPPGFTANPPSGQPYLTKPNFGGLLQVKFYPRDPAQRGGNDDSYTDLPVFRYAEVLLINAEAKAELGTITQGDLDNTINLLRDRVNMPDLDLAYANAHVDPKLAADFPAVSGVNKGALLEIRRERRAELAAEGLRFDDLYRWKAGALLARPSEGMYVPGLGALDVTGDGEYDIAILEAEGEDGPIAMLPQEIQDGLVKYYLDGGIFTLSNGVSGFIRFSKDIQQPRSFIEPKYYYFPIPLQQTLLNKNLTQPPGW